MCDFFPLHQVDPFKPMPIVVFKKGAKATKEEEAEVGEPLEKREEDEVIWGAGKADIQAVHRACRLILGAAEHAGMAQDGSVPCSIHHTHCTQNIAWL